jgi:hypothetical protein
MQRESLRKFEQIYDYSDEEEDKDYEDSRRNSIHPARGGEGSKKGGIDDYLSANMAKLLGNDYKAAKESVKII